MYIIDYTETAKEHIRLLRHNDPSAFKKVTTLLLELSAPPGRVQVIPSNYEEIKQACGTAE